MDTNAIGDESLRWQIENYIGNITKKGYALVSAVLFGSRARGDNLTSSDVDLLLVVENPDKNFVERLQIFSALWGHKTPLEVFVYTPDEVREMFVRGSITLYDALNEGVLIRDTNFMTHLKQAFKIALDEKILSKSVRGWWKLPEDQNSLKTRLEESFRRQQVAR